MQNPPKREAARNESWKRLPGPRQHGEETAAGSGNFRVFSGLGVPWESFRD